jgi:hypothetical protein
MRDVRGNDGLMVKIVAVLVIKKIVAVLFKGFYAIFLLLSKLYAPEILLDILCWLN